MNCTAILLIKMDKTVNSYFSFMWLFHGLTATKSGFFHNQMSSEMASVSLTVQNRTVLIIRSDISDKHRKISP